jgi:predicted lipoprotein with Yx(FWY)xxD motif
MKTAFLPSAALALLLACTTAYAATPAQTMGDVLTNPAGMTLYTFDKDAAGSGKSVCNGDCAMKWPPFAAGTSDRGSGDYSVITRDDG